MWIIFYIILIHCGGAIDVLFLLRFNYLFGVCFYDLLNFNLLNLVITLSRIADSLNEAPTTVEFLENGCGMYEPVNYLLIILFLIGLHFRQHKKSQFAAS